HGRSSSPDADVAGGVNTKRIGSRFRRRRPRRPAVHRSVLRTVLPASAGRLALGGALRGPRLVGHAPEPRGALLVPGEVPAGRRVEDVGPRGVDPQPPARTTVAKG